MPNLLVNEVIAPVLSLAGGGLILFGIVVVFLRLEQSSARMVTAGLIGLWVGTAIVGATMEQTRKTIPPMTDLGKIRR